MLTRSKRQRRGGGFSHPTTRIHVYVWLDPRSDVPTVSARLQVSRYIVKTLKARYGLGYTQLTDDELDVMIKRVAVETGPDSGYRQVNAALR